MTATKRNRGGQPGNQNAAKHGFYSKALPPELARCYIEALKAGSTSQEIALIRSKVLPAIINDPTSVHLLPHCARLIDRLLRTQHLLKCSGCGKRRSSRPPCTIPGSTGLPLEQMPL